MKVVFDTNVFVSSFFGGNPRRIIDRWKEGRLTLCLSPQVVEEYFEVLKRLGLGGEKELEELAALFARGFNSLYTTETPSLGIVGTDPDDVKFLECAVAHGVRMVISGDRGLLKVKRYMNIEILSPAEFVSAHPD